MFLAQEAAAESAGKFSFFDLFMFAFTILIAIGVARLLKAEKKNKFAIGFGTLCLLAFLFIDFLVVLTWTGQIQNFQTMLFGS